jgi:ABC-2 type transport system permease protein
MIDGIRAAFIGHADGSIAIGIAVMAGLDVTLLVLCHALIAGGWKLKA